MTRPNLFSYATSELSQDAFICWLLAWAAPEHRVADPALHACAVRLIELLFRKHGKEPPSSIVSVEISKQTFNIDVLCVVNGQYALLIEDKTTTSDHSGQLLRYVNELSARFPFQNVLPIYFKTYDQACYANIVHQGYVPFLRKDFLALLNEGNSQGVHNEIFQDFRRRLHFIESQVSGYASKKVNAWGKLQWTGFYLDLQKKLEGGKWKYVPNQNDGFMGFQWAIQDVEGCRLFLQLEQKKLCFKILVKDPTRRRSLRMKWHKLLASKARVQDMSVERPERFGHGTSMTVLRDSQYIQECSAGYIELDATVERLIKAEQFLQSVGEMAVAD